MSLTRFNGSGELLPDEGSWSEKQREYDEYLRYWTGEVWKTLAENIVDDSDHKPLRWPVKINLIKIFALMHAMTLWGEWDGEIITFRADQKDPSEFPHPGQQTQEKAAKSKAETAQDVINAVWEENQRDTLLFEAGLAQPIYGGCVIKIGRDPTKEYGVRLEIISPYNFKPVWHPTDYHQLLQATIEYKITAKQAELAYGVKVDEDEAIYRETWDKDEYSITINGQPATILGEKKEGVPNRYGFVPFFYIPRLRLEEFYGLSMCPDLMGLQDELNDRVADVGDQILTECHGVLYLRNYVGNVDDLKPSTSGLLNLGIGPPGSKDPEIGRVPPGEVPRGAFEHINFILDMSKMAAFVPSVAFGQDEGSQRSGVTLVIRLWPLLQQAKYCRAFWNDGFEAINTGIIKMLEVDNSSHFEASMTGHRVRPKWSAVQPKDREALINELSVLASLDLQSLQIMVERLGNAEDTDEEIAQIEAFMRTKAKIEKEYGQKEVDETGQQGSQNGQSRGSGVSQSGQAQKGNQQR